MKTENFTSFSDLLKKAAHYNVYVHLSCDYYILVSKSQLKRTASAVMQGKGEFIGEITYCGSNNVQVKIY